MLNKQRFAEFVRENRERLNLSQQKLSDLCGVSRDAVSAWEQEKNGPSLEAAGALVRAFGFDHSSFIFEAMGLEPPVLQTVFQIIYNHRKKVSVGGGS